MVVPPSAKDSSAILRDSGVIAVSYSFEQGRLDLVDVEEAQGAFFDIIDVGGDCVIELF
jgi:hypothetical protein